MNGDKLGVVLRGYDFCKNRRVGLYSSWQLAVAAGSISSFTVHPVFHKVQTMSFSHTRLNSASEFVQQAPKEISDRVSGLYDVVNQAMGKEKERVSQRMSQIKETVGDGARGAIKKLPWQVSEKGSEEPLSKFRMAAKKTLYLRQQSKLDLNEHIQK